MKILKGTHICIDQFTGIWSGKPIQKNILFTDSCRYNVGTEQKDWNKLFGMSFGFFPLVKQFQMHENSARFGWRYNPDTDRVEVAPYLYTDGKREYAETLGIDVFSCEINRVYSMSITPFASFVLYTAGSTNWALNQNIPSHKGFAAPLYFGGNAVAPHTIEVF